MTKLFLYLVSVAILAILTQFYFSLRKNYRDNPKALAVKAAGTLVPVLLCVFAVAEKNAWHEKWLLLAAVFICMVADVVIGVYFVAGMMTFFIAHLCLIAYYLTFAPFQPISLLIFAVLYLSQSIIYGKYISKLGKKLPAYAAYPAALSLMFSVAVMLYFQLPGLGSACIAVGAGLFLISDSILANTQFCSNSFVKDRLVMYLYYPAVYLLAVSAFYL